MKKVYRQFLFFFFYILFSDKKISFRTIIVHSQSCLTMAKVAQPRHSVASACHRIRSDPEKLRKIFQSSLVDDFLENSKIQIVEHKKSHDSHTKRNIDTSIEYSKIIERNLDDDNDRKRSVKKTVKQLKRTKAPSSDADSMGFFNRHCPRSSMNTHAFESYSIGFSSRLEDDSVNDLTNQFDSLSTSGSES